MKNRESLVVNRESQEAGLTPALCGCGKEATQPHNANVPKWCRECWGKVLSEGKRKKRGAKEDMPTSFLDKLSEKRRGRPKGTKDDNSKAGAGITPPVLEKETVITVDFSEFQDVLESLKKEANDEVRTIEQQIVYILKNRQRIRAEIREEHPGVIS